MIPSGIENREEEEGCPMLFDRQKFVLAVHQALEEHDKEKDEAFDSGGHNIIIDCDHELEQFADPSWNSWSNAEACVRLNGSSRGWVC